MPDSIMYQGDYFLVLEADQPICPRQLAKFSSFEEKSLYLRDNYCELDLGEEGYLQWYLVRLEK